MTALQANTLFAPQDMDAPPSAASGAKLRLVRATRQELRQVHDTGAGEIDLSHVRAPNARLLSELLIARRANAAAGRPSRLCNAGLDVLAFLDLVQAAEIFEVSSVQDRPAARRAAA